MKDPRDCIATIDIGKTNAKVVLVGPNGAELTERRHKNLVLSGPPYPHFATEALVAFVLGALSEMAPRIRAIVPVTHGACAALVDGQGELALPVLDYEHDGPDHTRATYRPPPFSETGSPPLPAGLNLGAQLHWLEDRYPKAMSRAARLLMWPQWWAWRLCGIAAAEVTSLGCHTDLWCPESSAASSLARMRGWDQLLPPLRPADGVLGPILPEIARVTGLSASTQVLTGIHDSNASLLAYLKNTPCGILSTGTWIIAMALGSKRKMLDPTQDMLVNIAMDGRPVPTARFMGGRERDVALARGGNVDHIDTELGMRAAQRLQAIGADGPIYLEGPFAASAAFVAAVSQATGRDVIAAKGTGTPRGAASLAQRLLV
ncbi:MAG: carbohydrate kinase [Roseinatronobacter sp.]|nr:carbohydrate kinase [Roseinatronobacter sp.]